MTADNQSEPVPEGSVQDSVASTSTQAGAANNPSASNLPAGGPPGNNPTNPGAAPVAGSGNNPPPPPDPPPTPPGGYIPAQLFEARMKAHDFVQEHLKHIITIGSAVIAITVTFLKDIVGTKGDQLRFAWLLPFFWVLMGLSVCAAIYVIAVHVGNLDKANKEEPTKSFAAGANRHPRLLVAANILLFGGGMLVLGVFAAINYRVIINRGAHDYKISSAFQAVDEARKNLKPSFEIVKLDKVELTKGVDDSLAGTPTWNVQFEIRNTQTPAEQIAANTPSSTSCSHSCKQKCLCRNMPSAPSSTQFNFLIDARSGSLLTIVESDNGRR